MKTSLKVGSVIAIALLVASNVGLANGRSSARCTNVFVETSGLLGMIEVAPGIFTLGALPVAMTLGNVPGEMSSIITSLQASGANGQGAQHITLQHTFISTDPARPGTFITQDRAVCAPAGTNPATCRVNDVLTIVSGTGIFANAGGSLRNHGTIDLANFTVTISLRGRVCGDGL